MKCSGPCGQELDSSQFGSYKTQSGSVRCRRKCNACRRDESKARYRTSPEVAAKMKATARRHSLKTKYSITEEEYRARLEQQKGVCAICKKAPTNDPSKKSRAVLNVDHDHKTSRVRGLLCWSCNIALGHFEDNSDFLRGAASYLSRFQQPEEGNLNERDFVYWLQGYFELSEDKTLTEKQVAAIKNHLALVFEHVIDPSYTSHLPPEDAKKVQENLQAVHDNGPFPSPGKKPNYPRPDPNTVYRC